MNPSPTPFEGVVGAGLNPACHGDDRRPMMIAARQTIADRLRLLTPPGILTGGEVAEWPKAPLSKSGSALKVLVGSNPTLSANSNHSRRESLRRQRSWGLAVRVRPAIGSRAGTAPRRFAPLFFV